MNPLDKHDETMVVQHSTAILMQISKLVGNGFTFDRARKMALDGYGMNGISWRQQQNIRAIVHDFDLSDIDKGDARKASDNTYNDGVKQGFFKDAWYNRILWRYLGLTF